MLTMKGKYGLKALSQLARLESGESALGAELAEANNIPKKFLDAILADLRRGGLVAARKGRGGGYSLVRPPERIMLGDIVRLLDGPLAPIRCASRTAYIPCADCENVARCSVRLTMLEVRDAMAAVLDNTSLADMLASAKGRRSTRAPRLSAPAKPRNRHPVKAG
jgi:Rrf2 family protein